MDFEFSCFISYRGGEQEFTKNLMEDLSKALSSELELLLDEGVYYDKARLEGGNKIDPTLAKSLCRSLCMVVVFTSGYFSKTRPYCAREYLAMERLEEARQKLLVDKSNGLIIPIIVRDKEDFPPSIRRKRNYYDFTKLLPDDDRGLSKPHDYGLVIMKIAGYIKQRYRELKELDDPCAPCTEFRLPDQEDAVEWIEALLTPVQGKAP